MNDTFITYAPDGVGCFLRSGSFTNLPAAITVMPAGGHVEQVTEIGSFVVYPIATS